MKRFLWLGLILLSVSWLFFIPIFSKPDYNIGIILIILGIICNILGLIKHDFKKIHKKYLIILIPLILSLFVIPIPYNLGLIVLTVGLLLYIFKTYVLKSEKANSLFLSISLSGIILTIQMFFFPVYAILISHNHRVDILSPFVSTFSNLFGLEASVNNDLVFIQTVEQTYPFTTTWEKLGLFPWFNILIGA